MVRSMLFLVQFLSTCSGIDLKQPDELSCEKVRKPSGTDTSVLAAICSCDVESGNCTLSVTLEFGHVTIPKESTGLNEDLQMLGFNVPGYPGRSPGPTLRVRAGDTLRILLKNTMQPEQVSTATATNKYHGFDTVNLHTHGLHVSPLAPGDEVVNTKVLPANGTNQYIYHIPEDHMGGTHWYHPHWHGAVSMHVNFGAAGMIIVEDAAMQARLLVPITPTPQPRAQPARYTCTLNMRSCRRS